MVCVVAFVPCMCCCVRLCISLATKRESEQREAVEIEKRAAAAAAAVIGRGAAGAGGGAAAAAATGAAAGGGGRAGGGGGAATGAAAGGGGGHSASEAQEMVPEVVAPLELRLPQLQLPPALKTALHSGAGR